MAAIGVGLADLVKTSVILPFRTLCCIRINPPIKKSLLDKFGEGLKEVKDAFVNLTGDKDASSQIYLDKGYL